MTDYNYAMYEQFESGRVRLTYVNIPYKAAKSARIPHPQEEPPKMVNPCCCMDLKTGVKFVAIISLLWSLALIAEEVAIVSFKGCNGIALIKEQNPEFGNVNLATTIQPPPKIVPLNSSSSKGSGRPKNASYIVEKLKPVTEIPNEPKNFLEELDQTTGISEIVISGVWILTWVGDVALAITLIYGAYKKSIRCCSVWFHCRCAILVFRIIFLIIYAITGLPMVYKIPVIVLCLFRIYSLWVVSHFIEELKVEKEATSNPRVSVAGRPSKSDIDKFAAANNHPLTPPGMTPLW